MKNFTIIVFIVNIIVSYSFAQNATIKGKITDATTKEALFGVNIVLDKKTGTASDVEGNYIINVIPGKYTLNYYFIGYKSESRDIEIKPAETFTLDISLEIKTELINEIVVSAGKFEQKLSEVTVSMAVIPPPWIENTNTTSMETIINQIPGVDVLDGQPSIRGGSGYCYGAGSRVLLLVDDLPILTADAGDAKWDFLPVENIAQVEVLKGASSALFGSSALNGVINVRTAFPKDKPQTKIITFGGMYMKPERKELIWKGDTLQLFYGASLFHSRKIGNLDLVIGGNVFNDDGYRENEYETRYRYNMNLRYRAKKIEGLSYGVNTNMMTNDKIDFFLWEDADSGAYRQDTAAVTKFQSRRMNIDPYITYYNKKGNRHSLKTRYFSTSNVYKKSPDKDNEADSFYGEYQYQKNIKDDLNWTVGVAGTYAEITAKLYGNHNSSSSAFFTQLDEKISDKLSLSLGVRWERYSLDSIRGEANQVFRTGINYQLAEYTFLRASCGQGYRFPTIAEKYAATSVSSLNIFPNPELEPETGWSMEIGIKQGVKISNWNGYIDIAGFWTEYHNMMEYIAGIYNPDSVTITWENVEQYAGFKSLNVGNAKITGIDIIFTGEGKLFGIPATLLAGYTYTNPINMNIDVTDSTYSTKDNILKYRYYHSAKADIELKYKKISTGFSFIYKSFMINIDKTFEEAVVKGSDIYMLPGLKEYREENNKGYIVFDHRISYQLTEKSKLALITKNIFNKEYMGRPGDIGAQRNMALQYSLVF